MYVCMYMYMSELLPCQKSPVHKFPVILGSGSDDWNH